MTANFLRGVGMPDVSGFAVNATVVTFILGYILNEYKKRRDDKIARRKYLLALCAEIELNSVSLEKTIRQFPATRDFRQFLRNGPASASPPGYPAAHSQPYRPHFINNYLHDIFKQNVAVLSDMPDMLIRSIIDFYGKLEWIDITVDSIEKQGFASISVEGREAVIESLRIHIHEARQQGQEILGAIRLLLDPRRPV